MMEEVDVESIQSVAMGLFDDYIAAQRAEE